MLISKALACKPDISVVPDRNHPLQFGLIAHWTLSEGGGTNIFDLSQFGHHGVLTNADPATDWVIANDGYALDFDGDNDFIDLGNIPTSSRLQLNGTPFTIFVDMTPETTGDQYQRFIDKSTSGFATNGFALSGSSARTSVDFYTNGGTVFANQGTLVNNVRTQLAITYDGSTNYRLYQDGVQVAFTSSGLAPPSNACNMRIGSWNHSTGREYNGKIHQIRVYDRQLRAEEILDLTLTPYQDFILSEPVLLGLVAVGGGGITGTSAWTEDDDTMAASGLETITGASAWTEDDDTMSASGVVVTVIGTAAWNEENDTMVATGIEVFTGAVAFTEANDTMVASGVEQMTGTITWTEDDDTMVAVGNFGNDTTGTASWTEDDDTIAASGLAGIRGPSAWTEESDTMLSTGIGGEVTSPATTVKFMNNNVGSLLFH